jgi:hypothetical protein
MRGLRTSKGCSRLDHIENADIRKELEIKAIQNKINKDRQNRAHHLRGVTEE